MHISQFMHIFATGFVVLFSVTSAFVVKPAQELASGHSNGQILSNNVVTGVGSASFIKSVEQHDLGNHVVPQSSGFPVEAEEEKTKDPIEVLFGDTNFQGDQSVESSRGSDGGHSDGGADIVKLEKKTQLHNDRPTRGVFNCEDLQNSLLKAQIFETPRSDIQKTFPKYETTQTCPTSFKGTAKNRRSVCPWSYHTDSDANRCPQNITYAKCQCSECIANSGSCEPVMQNKVVLMKDVTAESQYRAVTIQVPIACVCSRYSNVRSGR